MFVCVYVFVCFLLLYIHIGRRLLKENDTYDLNPNPNPNPFKWLNSLYRITVDFLR